MVRGKIRMERVQRMLSESGSEFGAGLALLEKEGEWTGE